MTTIRATCPICGEVDLSPDQIRLTVVPSVADSVGPDSHYTFICPSCEDRVHKPADERIARLLTTGGVAVSVLDQTAGASAPPHPECPPAGPALTYDDLLDLHLLLREDDWFDSLVAARA